eukprot:scaffold161061_cov70-Attheya_sp.AAC.1
MVSKHDKARKHKSYLLAKAKREANPIRKRQHLDKCKETTHKYREKLKNKEKLMKEDAELTNFVVQQIKNDEASTSQELNNEALDYLIDSM